MDARTASIVLSFGGLGLYMSGRFIGSWVMSRVRAEMVLFCCAVGTVVMTGLVLLSVGVASLVALVLIYVFEAIMFPTIFAISLKGLGIHTKRASSYLMMSPIGGAVGPLMMGYVADHTDNITFSFIVPFIAFLILKKRIPGRSLPERIMAVSGDGSPEDFGSAFPSVRRKRLGRFQGPRRMAEPGNRRGAGNPECLQPETDHLQ